jgi:sec-independent protein translocase protein TatB
MLDLAWPEVIVIGAVVLVAVGPKDLPKVMYAVGRWAGRARAFTQEMRRAFEQVSYEAEVAEKMKNEPKTNDPT